MERTLKSKIHVGKAYYESNAQAYEYTSQGKVLRLVRMLAEEAALFVALVLGFLYERIVLRAIVFYR